MSMATTLGDAISTLDPGPLDESQDDWYVENLTSTPGGHKLSPLAMLRASILRARDGERLFLSGHTGSGKTTELRRLLRDPKIRRKFFVVNVAFAKEELPELTSAHLLFILAAELYAQASAASLLGKGKKHWESLLRRLNERFFAHRQVSAGEGAVEVKFNLVFLELRQQLKLQGGRREEFRTFAETEGTILVDLINALVEDIQLSLLQSERGEQVLVVIDETDKLRANKQLEEIFHTNLALLRAPSVPIVMMLPASVTFGGPTTELGANITHLRPVQVLQKTDLSSPLAAFDWKALPYLRDVLGRRVQEGLFETEVIEQAAVYSGGVLRNFFELLRNAAIRALDIYGLTTVDVTTFNDQLEDERNALVRVIYPTDRAVLSEIRARHTLPDRDALRLLNTFVLEYNGSGIWWEVTPLLWHIL